MSHSNFQGSITGKNVIAGNHVSDGGTVNYYLASPPASSRGLELDEALALKKEKEDCLRSLIFPNLDARYNDIIDAHPDTCNWLFSTAEFDKWSSRVDLPAHNGVLWIKGKPGVGKSTLMKHTLRHCQKIFDQHLVLSHFFNARGDVLERTPQGLWRSIVYQILTKDGELYEAFASMFRDMQRSHQGTWEWQQSQLKGFVASALTKSKSTSVVILIDALDECSEQEVRDVVDFLEFLSIAAVKAGAIVRTCLSSRHYPRITIKRALELTVENIQDHQGDIAIYIKDKLRASDGDIDARILHKANGIFMWVVLVISLLNKAFDEGQVEAIKGALEEVPDDLEAVFTTLLRREDQRETEMILMLQWVLLSERPLTPKELFSVAVDEVLPSTEIMERRIISSSKGLIEIRQGYQNTVQFIHQSVNDFLFRNGRLQRLDKTLGPDPVGTIHGRLWDCCWLYVEKLGTKWMAQGQGAQLCKQFPLLDYALRCSLVHADKALLGRTWSNRYNWYEIFSHCMRAPGRQEHVITVLRKHEKWFSRWMVLMNALYNTSLDSHTRHDLNGGILYFVSGKGYENLVRALVLEGLVDVNAKGGKYGNALQASVTEGNETIARFLVERGADINTRGGFYGSALLAAVSKENQAIVRLLVEKGANINARSGWFSNPLHTAVMNQNEGIVRVLIEKGADVNARGSKYGNALLAAVIRGDDSITKLLIEKGADVNAKGGKYGNVLQAAIAKKKEALVRLLVEKGANTAEPLSVSIK